MYKVRYWLPFVAVWVLLCILLFLSIYGEAKKRTIDELNARQRIHARQAARGIEYFFQHWIAQLSIISEKEDIRDFDIRGRETMETVFGYNRKEITALTRIDAQGTILYTVPEVAGVVGKNISDQKHIQRILETHEPVASDVFRTVQGYDAIVLHTPVFLKGQFNGTVAALFDFKTISKRYLETIRIGTSGYAWMLSADGIELFSPIPGHVGRHFFEKFKDYPTIIEMAKEMLAGKAGTTVYHSERIGENRTGTVTKHAVYMPVRILDTFWSIAVASTEVEALSGLESFKDKLFVVIALILFGSVVFTFLGLKASHVLQEDEKRSQAEQSLRESEEKYRSAMEAAYEPMVVYDTTGRATYVNPAFTRVFGWTSTEVIGQKINFVPKEEKQKSAKEIERLIREGSVSGFETRRLTKTGKVLDISISASVYTDNESRHKGSVVNLTDISRMKQTQEKLRKSEAFLKGFFRAAPVGLGMAKERIFQMVNVELCEMTGYSAEELTGMEAMKLYFDEKNYLATGEDYYGQVRDRGFGSCEARWRRKDGQPIDVLMNAVPVSPDAAPTEIVFAVLNITERKRAEEALDKSEERYRDIVEGTDNLVTEVDTDGRFTFVNESSRKVFGLDPKACIGRLAFDFVHENDRKETMRHFARWIEEKKPRSTFENRQVSVTGEVRDMLWTISFVFDDKNNITSIKSIARDITERKKAERELERYREHLEELVEERTQALKQTNDILQKEIAERKRVEEELRDAADTQIVLVREVNHRVKNNLSAIIGMLHMEEDRIHREGHTQYLPVLDDLICRIEGLSTVHSLLSASGWRPLNVHELCRRVVDAALKGIAIGKEVDVKIGTSSIRINSNQAHHLTLVINELATNSMKYAFDGRDRIVIQVTIEQMDANLRIDFRDNGPGYPPKILLGDPKPTSIGFDMIKGITRHSLDGTVDFTNDDGACATIVFKNELKNHPGG